MSNAGAFVVAVAGAALNLGMVWRNDPAGVYEQGRYRQGLIRNLGDLIAPPCEKNRHRCAMRYTNQAPAFWTTDLVRKEIATAITNEESGKVVLLAVLKAEGGRMRSLSIRIVPMRQGNHPEGPCGGKGDTGIIELLC